MKMLHEILDGDRHLSRSQSFEILEQICHHLRTGLKLRHGGGFAADHLLNQIRGGFAIANAEQTRSDMTVGFAAMAAGTVHLKDRIAFRPIAL